MKQKVSSPSLISYIPCVNDFALLGIFHIPYSLKTQIYTSLFQIVYEILDNTRYKLLYYIIGNELNAQNIWKNTHTQFLQLQIDK